MQGVVNCLILRNNRALLRRVGADCRLPDGKEKTATACAMRITEAFPLLSLGWI
jgi:hypothetical protein